MSAQLAPHDRSTPAFTNGSSQARNWGDLATKNCAPLSKVAPYSVSTWEHKRPWPAALADSKMETSAKPRNAFANVSPVKPAPSMATRGGLPMRTDALALLAQEPRRMRMLQAYIQELPRVLTSRVRASSETIDLIYCLDRGSMSLSDTASLSRSQAATVSTRSTSSSQMGSHSYSYYMQLVQYVYMY